MNTGALDELETMDEISKNASMTQADAMDELFLRKNNTLIQANKEIDDLKKELLTLKALENENIELKKELEELRKYKEKLHFKVHETIGKNKKA